MSNTSPESALPRLIDPRKFAQKSVSVSGNIEISQLSRLRSMLMSDVGSIEVELQFDINEQKHRTLVGELSAVLTVQCQRCLEVMEQSVEAQLNLAVVWDDDGAKQLDKSFDPWIVPEGQADIYEVIEEELILSLPIVNYHDWDCVPSRLFSSGKPQAEGESQQVEEKTNPFKDLAALKSQFAAKDSET